jgi:patatin-like phospholipase/acyl hydrolase
MGGGYRGLFTAKVLAEIEKQTGTPIWQQCDLISGTSIGGILALALAYGVPASTMVDLFVSHGDAIFSRRINLKRIWRSPYSQEVLRKRLIEIFGSDTMGSLKTRVIIPTINYSAGVAQLFKTPHDARFYVDHARSIVDVALATSAAPTFFPRHVFDNNQYVDGGLFANFPGQLALHEAEHFLQQDINCIHMLAIGTMSSRYTVDPTQRRDGGLLDWGRAKSWRQLLRFTNAPETIIQLGISVQESLCNKILEHRLGSRYILLDREQTKFSEEAVGLAKADVFSNEVLLGNAASVAQEFLGSEHFTNMKGYRAPAATFYHGANANYSPSGEHTNA